MTEKTKLYLYQGFPTEEALVVGMWTRMQADGDLERTFMTGFGLTNYLMMIRPPSGLLYALDRDGIWFASWFEPFLSGMHVGIWVRMDKRRSRQMVATAMRAWAMLLSQVPVVFGVTKQEGLLRLHRALGYHILAKAPQLWDKEDAWVMMLTREGHDAAVRRFGKGLARWETRQEEAPDGRR